MLFDKKKYKGVTGTDELGNWFRERDGGLLFNWFMDGVVGHIGFWMYDRSMPYCRFYELKSEEDPS